ncbi:LytR/AlgR family response regulator transcription factor [Flavilitoribacter nigricans]|uniref:DNA-binding response regulator n=1 Tax=Flavilitoribacter nigricans (strain ATCC 23147 / DSM 23189 / NBRC 102662 / NCIMB 1420 / SS-2) TaxID=1122177 RepID=A0A2D0NF16_FLAN2|nr:LytTR family DNA-binding domain-containing protein [Flavilitoribacter nigricans]PHN07067.1 DNA-binding response regulator [Flavilitoribacter nigricans DSM 23189 = NBRC 102662]
MINAVIVEDEQHNREYLGKLLERYCPDIQLLAAARDVGSGLKAIEAHQPDLLFLDVEMPDGTGFDLLQQLPAEDFSIIFVTAYDHYALDAIRFCAIDYLLKPLKVEHLKAAVQKVIRQKGQQQENRLLRQLLNNISQQDPREKRIALPTQEEIILVKVSEIIRCQGENNYTGFYLRDGRHILVSRTLREFEDLLGEYSFLRCHQSHLVNMAEVRSFVKSDGGYLLMNDDSRVNVSRHRKDKVLAALIK